MWNIIFSIITGIVSGIIASVILNHYYWNKKPKILVSDYIAKNDKNECRIKFINKSKFYVTNVIIQLQLVTVTNGDGGIILNSYNLDIPYSKIQFVCPYDKHDKNAAYAIRFVLPKNLEELWKDDNSTSLKLIIYCSNEHNNASKLIEHTYHKKNCIKKGEFEFGTSLEIK